MQMDKIEKLKKVKEITKNNSLKSEIDKKIKTLEQQKPVSK